MAQPVREAIYSADPNLSIYQVQTMREHVANAQVLPRMAAWIFGFAGAASLLLAAVGLYGVMSYSVSRRNHEIGIRMALGEKPADVLRRIAVQGMRVTVIGALLRMTAAFAATRVLANLL